jgi:uncharacterized membrane protein YccC
VIRGALAEAVVTMLAVVATLAMVALIAPEPGPLVLGAMLCLSLSRSQLERDRRGRVEAGVVLPVIGLAAAGVGTLLIAVPVAGAIVYVLGLSLSIWLRRFGELPRRIGALIALPFIALLVAPAPLPQHSTGPFAGLAWLVPVLVSLLAFAFVTVFQLGAQALHVLPRAETRDPAAPAQGIERSPLDPTTKLALQMALSLALAFAVGLVFFADRWAWIVLTVAVVAIGNTGRADVLYKGVQRLLGATAGTVLALVPLVHLDAPSAGAIALLLGAVFFAVLLRRFGYIWWTLFITLALALLQGFTPAADGADGVFLLTERLEEIVLGTAIALVVAWFVLPLRSENTIRRRVGGVLVALQARAGERTPETDLGLRKALAQLGRSSAPYDVWNRVGQRLPRPRAARWISTVRECVELGRDAATPEARRALGEARRALREPEQLQGALERLRTALEAGRGPT